MATQTNLAEQRVPLNWLQMLFVLSSIVSATFTVTNIYNNFELERLEIKKLKSEIQNINNRIDKKTLRNEEMIKKLHAK